MKLNINYFCIPESFYANISHQFFEHKITFVNSKREKKNQNICYEDSWYTKKKILSFGMTYSINKHLRLKIPYTQNEFSTLNKY